MLGLPPFKLDRPIIGYDVQVRGGVNGGGWGGAGEGIGGSQEGEDQKGGAIFDILRPALPSPPPRWYP